MKSDPRGHWCINYRKIGDEGPWKTMKIERSDGVIVAAKTYDEVFKFVKVTHAFNFAKKLVSDGKYDAGIKKVSKGRGDTFYLAGA
jgi:predicted esterase YcpF (UPF0227 family)